MPEYKDFTGSRLRNEATGQQADKGGVQKVIKLSIIIPCYNAEPYINQLLECLNKQMRADIEVIIVDDGSKKPFKTDYPWATVYRKENEGPGIARNMGLDNMHGEYFTFIDADDLVADNYIKTICQTIEAEHFDYCYLSWTTMPGGWKCTVQLNSVEDKFPGFNLCVWNRVYKTATFGKQRFDPKKLWSEDADFIYRLNEHGKKSFIQDIMYYYRSDTPDSWTKRMMKGELDYTRIVYNVPEVKADNTALLDEIKKEYAENEIILLTDKLEIPELEHYCMIMKYNTPVHGTILRGDSYRGFTKIIPYKRTQILIWTARTQQIGGIETWIYQFCRIMSKYYDITVMFEIIDPKQLERLQMIVECIVYDPQIPIACDTCIISRITDKLPDNVKASRVIQMVHTCKMVESWTIPQEHDHIVAVSRAAADSFNEDKAKIIYNMTESATDEKCLMLISATRLSRRSAFEKGHERMLRLADMLEASNIPYIWLLFSDDTLKNARRNMVILPPTLDIAPYLAKADYYVSLSDAEGYGYSMVEALVNGTALITTPIDVLPEIGFKEGEHGYIVPFDMDFDVKKLLKMPDVKYKHNNMESVKQWRTLLGNTKPKHAYKPQEKVSFKITKRYKDIQLNRVVNADEVIRISKSRADSLHNAGVGTIV